MQQKLGIWFYKSRYVWAGIFIIGFLVAIAAIVTVIGAHSAVDSRTATRTTASTSNSDDPNSIAVGADQLLDSSNRAMLRSGTALYSGCRMITDTARSSGQTITRAGVATIHGTATVTRFTMKNIGSSIMFSIRLPGTMVHTVTSGQPVNAIIQPTADNQVPVIDIKPTAAFQARLAAQAKQDIVAEQNTVLEAAQAVANRTLDGTIVAGDPDHGGYPSTWANSYQDSRLDSWGMYNRECVSYVAWKVYQAYGDMPYWGGVGNANQWIGDARAAGIATGSTPRLHSVAISMRGYYGHAMWVEAVSGNMIYVSQYNYDLHGHYSEMWVNGSAFTYIYFK